MLSESTCEWSRTVNTLMSTVCEKRMAELVAIKSLCNESYLKSLINSFEGQVDFFVIRFTEV